MPTSSRYLRVDVGIDPYKLQIETQENTENTGDETQGTKHRENTGDGGVCRILKHRGRETQGTEVCVEFLNMKYTSLTQIEKYKT